MNYDKASVDTGKHYSYFVRKELESALKYTTSNNIYQFNNHLDLYSIGAQEQTLQISH